MSDRLRKPKGMSDEEWRERLIARLGFEPRDYVSEVVVSDSEGARDIEVTQADGSTSMARRAGSEVDIKMKGPPPRNEDDVEVVLAVLARHLSTKARRWHSEVRDETEPEMGADGRLVRPDGGTLDVQVTRGLADHSLMRELGKGTVSKRVDADHVARELLAAARRKASPRRGSDEARSRLVLAIDAGRLPHSILPPVLEASSRLSAEVTALGFRAVFVVGKNDSRTYRLDLGAPLDQDRVPNRGMSDNAGLTLSPQNHEDEPKR